MADCFASIFFLSLEKQICSLGLKLTLHQMISSKLWASVLIRKDSDGEALVDDLCCYSAVWRFFWKEVLAFPGSFKQTNNVFHGKLSGCHMEDSNQPHHDYNEELRCSQAYIHALFGNWQRLSGTRFWWFNWREKPPTGKIIVECKRVTKIRVKWIVCCFFLGGRGGGGRFKINPSLENWI